MHSLISTPSLSYDDMLILPQPYQDQDLKITSRTSINTSIRFGPVHLDLPIINAPMDTICSLSMYQVLSERGCLPCTHRFMPPADQALSIFSYRGLNRTSVPLVATIGAKEPYYQNRVNRILSMNPNQKLWLIDIANGYSPLIEQPIKYLKTHIKDSFIIAGNVCTARGFQYLSDLGANAIRVGIGNGAVCSTRTMTGISVGQASAIMDIALVRNKANLDSILIIADGGIKNPSDLCKALALGADMVMIGSMFAGTDQCPSRFRSNNGSTYTYRGMASRGAMKELNPELGNKLPEGVELQVKAKGDCGTIIDFLAQGLRSSMSYVNARSLRQYRSRAILRTVTYSTYLEGLSKG